MTIRPAAPASDPTAGGLPPLSDPGGVSAFVASRLSLGNFADAGTLARSLTERMPARHREPAGTEHVLVLHVADRIDIAQLRRALVYAGLPDMPIEIVPVPRHG